MLDIASASPAATSHRVGDVSSTDANTMPIATAVHCSSSALVVAVLCSDGITTIVSAEIPLSTGVPSSVRSRAACSSALGYTCPSNHIPADTPPCSPAIATRAASDIMYIGSRPVADVDRASEAGAHLRAVASSSSSAWRRRCIARASPKLSGDYARRNAHHTGSSEDTSVVDFLAPVLAATQVAPSDTRPPTEPPHDCTKPASTWDTGQNKEAT